MNYYEHHLGDYAKDTGHLSMLEHGAYRLLLDRYYSKEAGIPAAQAYRIARARSTEECQAVDVVLEEFFMLVDGVWINSRAEEEISSAMVRIYAAQANGKKGGRPPKKPIGSEMETQQKPSGFSSGSEMETQQKAHQAPITNHQSPEKSVDTTHASRDSTVVTTAGDVCARLRREVGLIDVSPQHPKLLALIAAGLTEDEIVAAGHEAKGKGKGFAYALAIAEGRRRDAANVKPLPDRQPNPSGLTKAGQKTAEAAARWLASQGVEQ